MTKITICPFCLTIFLYTEETDDECPNCEIGTLEDLDDYRERTMGIDNNEQ
jgi:hypothetical protein